MGRRDGAVRIVSSALGLGHLPLAPGTWASAVAAAGYVALRQLPAPWSAALLCGLMGLIVVGGTALAPAAEKVYGRRDPRQFVLDEVAGQWLACLALWRNEPVVAAIAAFAAFRVFDVAKPFPIRRIEKLPGGWGVMMDDLAAGAYAALAVWVVGLVAADGLLS